MLRFLSILLITKVTSGELYAQGNQQRALILTGNDVLVTRYLDRMSGHPAARRHLESFEQQRGFRALDGRGARYVRISPTLTYDPNVTGGVPNDSIDVAGFRFRIDPDFVAQGDILAGVKIRAGLRQNLAENTALDLRFSGSAAYAPRVQVMKINLDAEACLRFQQNAGRHFHICGGGDYRYVKLGEVKSLRISSGVTQAFTSSHGVHSLGLEIGERQVMPDTSSNWSQDFLRISASSALSNGTAITSGLEFGSKVTDIHSQRFRATVGIARYIADRPASLSAHYATSKGGRYMGQPRKDRSFGVSAGYQISDRVSVSMSAHRTLSNADLMQTSLSKNVGISIHF
ncbi:hypothetical protein LY39_03396 [Roseinatronobacter bogoriensis subsp. barguzinensis]|nr:hypothetical protein LY39_03396 [Rhodobaca barguzinensis]TDY67068.1 hypothetical protein EV660_10869 [Rhodobaca bogoriensis DSM 18756]